MNKLLLFLVALAALIVVSCTPRVQASTVAQGANTPPQQMLNDLISALNSKNESQFRAYLEKYAPDNLDQRLPRLMTLADRGAPFKILNMGTETSAMVKALVQDKNGEQFTFALDFSKE